MAPFIFIVGCGRSGTTLLRSMLDSHPDVAVPGEARFLTGFLTHPESIAAGPWDEHAFVEALGAEPSFDAWGLPIESVAEALASSSPASFADGVRGVYRCYADSHGKARFADKTPSLVLHLPILADLFPEGRFVHLVRDGRDVALSTIDAPWGPDTVVGAAHYWRRHVTHGRNAGREIGPERYREVRYEDLVTDPERVAVDICEFGELDYEPSMLDYSSSARDAAAMMSTPANHQALLLPPTTGLRNWRTEMAPTDVAVVEQVASAELRSLGYPLAGASVDARARLTARAVVSSVSAKEWAKRTVTSARRRSARVSP
jgi:hypothetical protein